jgi:DUF4097 and DUF4098 domain-containing protein YvlB
MRALYLNVLLLAVTQVMAPAVTRTPLPAQTVAPPEDLCAERNRFDSRRQHHCDVREEVLGVQAALDVDPGQNGSVRVRGWSRPEVRLRTRVEGAAETAARARELVSSVKVTTAEGRIRSNGMMSGNDEHWSVSFYLDVPSTIRLAINTRNGGISLEEFSGAAWLRAVNGSLTLRRVGGEVRGQTQNGSLHIDLAGARWEGTGLDVETRNGGIRLTLPANYSAELETGTVHGRVDIDFPVVIHSGRQRVFTATLGSGGPKVRAMTTNGSVVVRRE